MEKEEFEKKKSLLVRNGLSVVKGLVDGREMTEREKGVKKKDG